MNSNNKKLIEKILNFHKNKLNFEEGFNEIGIQKNKKQIVNFFDFLFSETNCNTPRSIKKIFNEILFYNSKIKKDNLNLLTFTYFEILKRNMPIGFEFYKRISNYEKFKINELKKINTENIFSLEKQHDRTLTNLGEDIGLYTNKKNYDKNSTKTLELKNRFTNSQKFINFERLNRKICEHFKMKVPNHNKNPIVPISIQEIKKYVDFINTIELKLDPVEIKLETNEILIKK